MGATDFMIWSKGKTAKEAFKTARDQALYESGHGGYTGTIAEKHEFRTILAGGRELTREKIREHAEKLLNNEAHWTNDKWGPAACIDAGDGKYLFFGWASC